MDKQKMNNQKPAKKEGMEMQGQNKEQKDAKKDMKKDMGKNKQGDMKTH